MDHVLKYIYPPSSNGSEDPWGNVSGGVDGVATVAAQRNPDKQNKETHSDGLAACRSWFVFLIRQSHYADQEHGSPKHLVAQISLVNMAKKRRRWCLGPR